MTVFTLVTAIIIAFVYGWQLTLLILACIPFIVGANAVNASSMSGHAAEDQKALEEAGRVSSSVLTTEFCVRSLLRTTPYLYHSRLNCPR